MSQKKQVLKNKPKKPTTKVVGTKGRNPDGTVAKGAILNPEGKGGFQERPQDRSDGRWNKEGSISYQYNYLMRLPKKEFAKFKPETVAQEIALARVRAAKSMVNGLADTKEITDRTEGKAPQFIGLGDSDEFKERIGATIVFEENPEAEVSNTDVS